MAEVKIRADAGNLQRGIKVTTQQAQKLTKALTQKKVPLLHAQETQKSVKANAQFSRGLVQSARGMKQVNRQARMLAQTQQRQIAMQKQMIQQQREYIQLLKQTQGSGGGGGGAPVGGLTGRLRSFRKRLDSRIEKASAPFGEMKKIIGSVKGIAGAFLAPIAVPVAAMAALGSRGTATAMQRQAGMSQLFAVTGSRNLGGIGGAGVSMGFSRGQSYQMAAQYAQAQGRFDPRSDQQRACGRAEVWTLFKCYDERVCQHSDRDLWLHARPGHACEYARCVWNRRSSRPTNGRTIFTFTAGNGATFEQDRCSPARRSRGWSGYDSVGFDASGHGLRTGNGATTRGPVCRQQLLYFSQGVSSIWHRHCVGASGCRPSLWYESS